MSDDISPERGRTVKKYAPAITRGEFGRYVPRSTKELTARARELRRKETPAERILWQRLRAKQVAGAKFRRQHPLGRFIADFFCDDARLVIELDGGVHDEAEQRERDISREELLQNSELHILRFTNDAILKNLEVVMQTIAEFVGRHRYLPSPPLPPSPEASGEGGGKRGRKRFALQSPIPILPPLPKLRERGAGG